MNAANLIYSLDRFGSFLPNVVRNVSPGDARWKPIDGNWSILEVVCHLADEEVDDFRTRLRLTLEDPTKDWLPIDPKGWAVQRKYNEGRLEDAVARFTTERSKSVQWLRGLKHPDWSLAHHHPKFPPISAGDLLTSWAAHDALHLRQISKRLYQLAQRDGGKFSAGYAGEWTA